MMESSRRRGGGGEGRETGFSFLCESCETLPEGRGRGRPYLGITRKKREAADGGKGSLLLIKRILSCGRRKEKETPSDKMGRGERESLLRSGRMKIIPAARHRAGRQKGGREGDRGKKLSYARFVRDKQGRAAPQPGGRRKERGGGARWHFKTCFRAQGKKNGGEKWGRYRERVFPII